MDVKGAEALRRRIQEGPPDRNRVHRESDAEAAMAHVIAEQMSSGVGLGLFSTGKTIQATQMMEVAVDIVFTDGSAIRIHGAIGIEYFEALSTSEPRSKDGSDHSHTPTAGSEPSAPNDEVIEDAEWKEV